MGAISCYGHSATILWENLLAGNSGIDTISSFDTAEYTSKIGSEVKDFDPGAFMDPKEARRNDRYTQFAVASTKVALKHAGVETSELDPTRFLRVHRSAIVALDQIMRLESGTSGTGQAWLRSGHTVPVSRSRIADVRRRLR